MDISGEINVNLVNFIVGSYIKIGVVMNLNIHIHVRWGELKFIKKGLPLFHPRHSKFSYRTIQVNNAPRESDKTIVSV